MLLSTILSYLFEAAIEELLIMKDNISPLLTSNVSRTDSTQEMMISTHIQTRVVNQTNLLTVAGEATAKS